MRRVFGRAVDGDGRPIAGVEVQAAAPGHPPGQSKVVFAFGAQRTDPGFSPARRVSTTSGETGAFDLELPISRQVHLALRHAGFADLVRTLPGFPPAGRGLQLGDLVLERAVVLSGRVIDEAGRPVSGAEVLRRGFTDVSEDARMDWSELVLATCSADGRFVLDRLALGRTELEVRAPGFVPLRHQVLAEDHQEDHRLDEWHVVLETAAPIIGRVVGAPVGETLEISYWMHEEREQRTARCAADGSFVVDGLPSGLPEIRLFATRVSRAPRRRIQDATVSWARERISPSVSASPGAKDVEIVVPAPSTYRLRVVDSVTREPLSDVSFGLLEGVDWEVATLAPKDEGPGVYSLSLLLTKARDGRALAVSCVGYERLALGQVPFVPGDTHDFGIVPLDPLTPTTLHVLMDSGEVPEEGVIVHIQTEHDWGSHYAHVKAGWPERSALPRAWQVRTGSDGTATVYLSSHQKYVIWIESDGGVWRLLTVGQSPPQNLELRLLEAGVVSVLCLDASTRAPRAGKWLDHEYSDVPSLTMVPSRVATGPDGRARFEHLAPGQHRFWPAELDADTSAQVCEVAAGDLLEVTLLLASDRPVHLHGRVTEHGEPVVGALVEARGGQVTTSAEGRYEFDLEEPGEVGFRVTPPRGPVFIDAIELAAPDTCFDVELSSSVVRGVVRDTSGALTGAIVRVKRPGADGSHEGDLHRTLSGPEGDFRFEAVHHREGLELRVEKAGYQTECVGLLLPADGSELVLTPVLPRAAELEVMVEAEPPQSLGLQVFARWRGERQPEPDDNEHRAESLPGAGSSGVRHFRFDRLRPGTWTIEVREPGDRMGEGPLAKVVVTLAACTNPPIVLRP